MPALRIYGLRTVVAGDDLRLMNYSIILFRLLQVGVAIPLAVALTKYRGGDSTVGSSRSCDRNNISNELHRKPQGLLTIYLIASLGLALCSMAIELMLIKVSSLGTPTQPEKREGVKRLCQIRMLPLGFARICVFALAMACLVKFNGYCNCKEDDLTVSMSSGGCSSQMWYQCFKVLVGTHIADIFAPVLLFMLWLLMILRRRLKINYSRRREKDVGRKWRRCCRACCMCSSLFTCCLCGGRDVSTADFSDVAITLSNYFDGGGTLDVVPSDVVAGLIMLLRLQRQKKLECRESLIQSGNCGAKEKDESSPSPNMMCSPATASSNKALTSARLILDEEDGSTGFVHDTQQALRNCHMDTCHIRSPPPSSEQSNVDRRSIQKIMTASAINEQRLEHGDADDAVPSDLARTIVYRLARNNSNIFYEPSLAVALSPDDTFDRSTVAEGARFIKMAQAIYTWMLYASNRPCTGCCTLCGAWVCGVLRCSSCKEKDNIHGENICGWHEISLLREAGLDESDIVYAQFREGFAVTPYCILLDHDWKSVVIAIRGTLSWDDMIADLTITPEPLDAWGDKCGFDGQAEYCHSGMLACADFIYNDLQKHKKLDSLLLGDSAKYPSYRLVIVGHSLGAGCAAVLSLILRSTFPDLRCLAYSPPGCVFSAKMASECADFVTSFVLDSDMIPCLSLQSMENLRNDVLDLVTRIKVPKKEVFNICVANFLRRRDLTATATNEKMLHHKTSIPVCEFSREVEEFKHLQETRKIERAMPNVQLYLPGRIVQMLKITCSTKKTCAHGLFRCLTCGVTYRGKQYMARWAQRGDFLEVPISTHFISDHHPANVCCQLERIADSFGLCPPYTGAKAIHVEREPR